MTSILASMPNAPYLEKTVVDRVVRTALDEELFWESKLNKQSVSGLTVLSYEDLYQDIETPNDEARGRNLNPEGRNPAMRSEHGMFPHTGIGEIEERVFKLLQFALEIDYTEEELTYTDLINQVAKKQIKLGKQFGSYVNTFLGNKLTQGWNPTTIQSIKAGVAWDDADFSAKPYQDILAADKKLRMVNGRSYEAKDCFVSKNSFYDLAAWSAEKDYELSYSKPTSRVKSIEFMGINIAATDMVKDGFAVMADFAQCGTLYEAEPFKTRVYEKVENRTFHVQATRRFNYNLTDPKAVILITDIATV